MKEEWLMPGAVVPVDPNTTKALVDEIKRLIGTIGGMALQAAAPVQENTMIYKTFEQWKSGNVLEHGVPRTEHYSEDQLDLVEMGWKYGYDAGRAVEQALDKKAENARELGLDYEPVPENFIDALKFDVAMRDAAPVQEPVAFEVGLVEWVGNKLMATPKTTTTPPASWVEMVTANLVREGVTKHKARELAEHFYTTPPAQPAPVQQERELLRTAQSEAVMPLIGPLLDAWEGGSDFLNEYPALDKQLRRIHRAMEHSQPAAPVQTVQEPEIVQRVKRYAGQTMRTARNPNVTARECIELANWIVTTQPAAQPAQQEPINVAQAYAMAQVCLDLHDAIGCKWGDNPYLAIDRLKTAAPVQEPVAWAMYQRGRLQSFWLDRGDAYDFEFTSEHEWKPLYTTPSAQRQWVGLTDEEIDQAWRSLDYTVSWAQHRIDIAQAIEAKLKEKNT
jgi:hypothetical protein